MHKCKTDWKTWESRITNSPEGHIWNALVRRLRRVRPGKWLAQGYYTRNSLSPMWTYNSQSLCLIPVRKLELGFWLRYWTLAHENLSDYFEYSAVLFNCKIRVRLFLHHFLPLARPGLCQIVSSGPPVSGSVGYSLHSWIKWSMNVFHKNHLYSTLHRKSW